MVRGTFANVRIKNLMVPGVEGGVTIYRSPNNQPDGERTSIYDAAMKYQADGVPLVVMAGSPSGIAEQLTATNGPALRGP